MAPKVLENRLDKTMIKYNEAIFNAHSIATFTSNLPRHDMWHFSWALPAGSEYSQDLRGWWDWHQVLLLRVLKGMLWPITIYHHLNSIPIWHNVGPFIYQNKIWPSTTRNNGRLPLQCSFPQAIVKRLKEERMGFDNQLAGIERTLKACHWEMVGIRYWRISRYIDLLKFGLWYLASLLDFSLASRQRSGTMKSFFCCPMMLTTPRRGGCLGKDDFVLTRNWVLSEIGKWIVLENENSICSDVAPVVEGLRPRVGYSADQILQDFIH